MSTTIGGNKLARVTLHQVMHPAFTPKRCKRAGKPFDKITERWRRHHHDHQLRKLDLRPLVVNLTKARHMVTSLITKVMETRDMVIRDMTIRAMAIRAMAIKDIVAKDTGTNKQDLSKASHSTGDQEGCSGGREGLVQGVNWIWVV